MAATDMSANEMVRYRESKSLIFLLTLSSQIGVLRPWARFMKFSTSDWTMLRIRCQKCGQHTEKIVTVLLRKDAMR